MGPGAKHRELPHLPKPTLAERHGSPFPVVGEGLSVLGGGGGLVAKLWPTLAILWTVRLSGSSVPGILQARIPEWVAISFSRGSSRPRNRTFLGLLHCRQMIYQLNYEGSPQCP